MYRLYTQIIYTIYTYLYIFTHHPARSHTAPRSQGGGWPPRSPAWPEPEALGLPGSCEVLRFFFFFLKAIASRAVLPLPKLKPLPQQHSEIFFLKEEAFLLLCHVAPGDPDPSTWPCEDPRRANPPSVPWGTPDGPQRAESPARLPLCALAGGYSVNGTCQMRRVLSVSPHGAGRPPPPAALPKLR